MAQRTGRVRGVWARLSTAGRLWWSAVIAVGTATALLVVVTTGADASSHAGVPARTPMAAMSPAAAHRGAPGTTTTAPPASPPTTAMGGMGAMAAGASGAPRAPAGICPNVTGATTMANGMVMAPVPAGPPTAAQQAAADKLVAEVQADLPRYSTLAAAEAAGYTPATDPARYYVHYANWQTVRAGDVLDPAHPSALMYANTLQGTTILLGAMFLGPGPCQPGPDIGGPLTDWHAHADLCLDPSTHQVVGNTRAAGSCAAGVHNSSTYFMLHVWTAPSLAAKYQFQADLPRSALVPIIRTGQA